MSRMEASDRFQGLCLVEMAGSETIETFDGLPPYARELIRNSSINLCAACVEQAAWHIAGDAELRPVHFATAVVEMERAVLRSENNGEKK